MKRKPLVSILFMAVVLWGPVDARAGDEPHFTRISDVIYGRKSGMALTMDVFTPRKDAHGLAIIWVVSGGWVSAHELVEPEFSFSPVNELIKRGYTVFGVVHGSQPKFTIPEILQDMNRAVRYIRYHAKDYKIDPDRIGITGGSAGGHLSLMQGTAGDLGDAQSKDPIDRTSSHVQAVACFFPPTDFLNYGGDGKNALGQGPLHMLKPPFDFVEFDPKQAMFGTFVRVTDEKKILEIGRQISPVTHVTDDDAPTLIIHGDADQVVPIQQAQEILGKLKGVKVPTKLVVREKAGHGWADLAKDMTIIAGWFDEQLRTNKGRSPSH
jgi:acetyl esterase/lipase